MTEKFVLSILQLRHYRNVLFAGSLFSDPAWEVLLELYAAELGRRQIILTELASANPLSTVQRWIAALEREGLVIRDLQPSETRYGGVHLTRDCSAQMASFIRDAREMAACI